ncbi:MAG: hypothetical protein AAGF27_10930 [Pseudomonadota bacterium]
MPLQNRVQPTGDILAIPERGAYMGNRGILHDEQQNLTRARWRHKAWVTCVLSFKGRRRHPLMRPSNYTELFFHDEAVAFAAGHRPCGECRRADYNRFRAAAGVTGPITAFDTRLHADRAIARAYKQRRHEALLETLPDGVFVMTADGRPALVAEDAVIPFSPNGYGAPENRPTGRATVLTPAALIDVLRAGYTLDVRL